MIKLSSISSRLIVTYLIIGVLTAALLIGMFSYGLKYESVTQLSEKLADTADTVCSVYAEGYTLSTAGAELNNRLKQIADFQDSRIWIYDKFGVRWFDVDGKNSGLTEKNSILEENLQALNDAISHSKTQHVTASDGDFLSTPIISYTAPLRINGNSVGYIIMHIRAEEYLITVKTVLKEVLYCLPLIILIALLCIFVTSRSINKPLDSISEATKELARGNFKKRADSKGLADVGGIIENFNFMAEELEKYETTRESFVGNVSHELRSPLTSISGFVEGMLDGTIEEEDKPKYLSIVLSETKRMNALINDLLDLAKFESGQFPMNFTCWDINELLRKCFISFITKIEEKQLDVSINIPDEKQTVYADKDRITQVITNLIDNAMKFCDQKGELKIWTNKTKDGVQISISNTGSIIPEEDIPFVFDRFFKVDKSHNRKAQGTGIGLSIVRTIIQQHGQKIWVNSKPGTGTVFTFTLSDKGKNKGKA